MNNNTFKEIADVLNGGEIFYIFPHDNMLYCTHLIHNIIQCIYLFCSKGISEIWQRTIILIQFVPS